jgi:condensin complex subunit 2
MGLLLNHLGVDGKGRLVFDAGDATVGDDEEETDPLDDEMVDLVALRRESECAIIRSD